MLTDSTGEMEINTSCSVRALPALAEDPIHSTLVGDSQLFLTPVPVKSKVLFWTHQALHP